MDVRQAIRELRDAAKLRGLTLADVSRGIGRAPKYLVHLPWLTEHGRLSREAAEQAIRDAWAWLRGELGTPRWVVRVYAVRGQSRRLVAEAEIGGGVVRWRDNTGRREMLETGEHPTTPGGALEDAYRIYGARMSHIRREHHG